MGPKAPRPAKAAGRYWRGKPSAASSSAAAAAAASSSESDDDGAEQVDARGVKRTLTEADLAKRDGFLIQTDLDLSVKPEPVPLRAPRASAIEAVDDDQAEVAAGESESSEESSSEEEESSEEEAPAQPLFKPVFVSKRNRDPAIVKKLTQDEEELAEIQRQADLEEQRKQAHQLVGDTLKRQIAEKEVKDAFPDVDDTDGLDAPAEFEAWKLRELQRIKREADALYAREQEREEVEKRRALPEDVRLQEDLEHARKTRADKPKGQQAFLQKYHHKGVFYTDDEIMQRDYTNVIEDQVVDVKSLPSLMQVRDFGKRSRTKHTHLADVDTTKDDAGWGKRALGRRFGDMGSGSGSASRACFNCGQEGHVARDCRMPRQEQRGREGDGRRRDDWGSHGDVREDRRPRSRSRSPDPRDKRRRVY